MIVFCQQENEIVSALKSLRDNAVEELDENIVSKLIGAQQSELSKAFIEMDKPMSCPKCWNLDNLCLYRPLWDILLCRCSLFGQNPNMH